jgi:hypothetical protein
MGQRALLVPFLTVACLLAGWGSQVRAAESVELSGKWHGSWLSCTNGHHGKLNARFCKIDDTSYRVRFTGTFLGAAPFAFTVKLAATEQENGAVVLTGNPRLPLFGTFHFSAVATDHDFTATYSARNDEGRFTLHR